MAYEHDDVLTAVRAIYPEAADVVLVYPDDDTQWWVVNINGDTFAYAWYESFAWNKTTFKTRLYTP